MATSVKREQSFDTVQTVSELVLPVYQTLPPAIQGREGAMAYSITDNTVYYCTGEIWRTPAGNQGAQGYMGAQGFQGATGVQGSQGFQGGFGGFGVQGAQGFPGADGAQGAQGASGGGASGLDGTFISEITHTTSVPVGAGVLPPGTGVVYVHAQGGGGGGGAAVGTSSGVSTGGGGGAAGYLATGRFVVTDPASVTYYALVGAGGTAGTDPTAQAGPGQYTVFVMGGPSTTDAALLARGGQGGRGGINNPNSGGGGTGYLGGGGAGSTANVAPAVRTGGLGYLSLQEPIGAAVSQSIGGGNGRDGGTAILPAPANGGNGAIEGLGGGLGGISSGAYGAGGGGGGIAGGNGGSAAGQAGASAPLGSGSGGGGGAGNIGPIGSPGGVGGEGGSGYVRLWFYTG